MKIEWELFILGTIMEIIVFSLFILMYNDIEKTIATYLVFLFFLWMGIYLTYRSFKYNDANCVEDVSNE